MIFIQHYQNKKKQYNTPEIIITERQPETKTERTYTSLKIKPDKIQKRKELP